MTTANSNPPSAAVIPPITPNAANAESMWALVTELFPLHRTLVSPGYQESLARISERYLPLETISVPSGESLFGWLVPKAFVVDEAHVTGPDGRRVIDYRNCLYHVWNYSQPFRGRLTRAQLLHEVATDSALPDAVPMRDSYYRPRWGLSAAQSQMRDLPEGDYDVVVATRHYDDFLEIGTHYLPGESEQEILISAHACHPLGANDNLSGMAVAVELFRILRRLPRRRFSYRLALWPETIGAIAWIAKRPETLKNIAGALVLSCLGDSGSFNYFSTYAGTATIDRVAAHVLRHSGEPHTVRPYAALNDERQFNTPRLRVPTGALSRTPIGEFAEYHTSADNLEFISRQNLLGSLAVVLDIVQALERNYVYEPTYVVEPFLSGLGIYPYDLGIGTGEKQAFANRLALTYYNIIPHLNGDIDLVEIADRCGDSVFLFDRVVDDFRRVGLIKPARAK